MTHVITALCVRYGSCVEVCPVDCIVPGPRDDPEWPLFYVDPDTCIDCGACVPVCPTEAIFAIDAVPAAHRDDIPRNAAFFRDGPGYRKFVLEDEWIRPLAEPASAAPARVSSPD